MKSVLYNMTTVLCAIRTVPCPMEMLCNMNAIWYYASVIWVLYGKPYRIIGFL